VSGTPAGLSIHPESDRVVLLTPVSLPSVFEPVLLTPVSLPSASATVLRSSLFCFVFSLAACSQATEAPLFNDAFGGIFAAGK